MPIIEEFSIKGLFGKKDVDLVFRNKVQIYIGENGLGKTTILNALYYLLSCDFKNLVSISFTRIDLVLLGKRYSLTKEELKNYLRARDGKTRRTGFYQRLLQTLSEDEVKGLQEIIRSGQPDMSRMQTVQQFLNKKGFDIDVPSDYIMESVTQLVVDQIECSQIDEITQVMGDLNVRILYFPTYRRIEKDVRTMLKERRNNTRYAFSGRNIDLESSFVEELSEAVHSGMSDIKKRRDSILRRISDISRKELDTMSVELLKTQIAGFPDELTLEIGDKNRIEAIIHKSQVGLTLEEQERVLGLMESGEIYNDNNKFLLFLLTRLKDIYNSYESYDLSIKSFVDICNGYLRDKKFTYNEADLILDLESTIKTGPIQEVLDLDLLSSGEKQLISLFATIYLDPRSRFVVLIDEPELSLSIYWQRKLLPDVMRSSNCEFLFAVTHSPFIFDNELQEFTTGMNEYVKS